MLELFAIFSKSGIVLWWFRGAGKLLLNPVNELIKNVLLEEKSTSTVYNHEKLALRYRLDNKFDLVFVAAYQTELALSYVDKLLTDVQREFRDKYRNDLEDRNYTKRYNFESDFTLALKRTEEESKMEAAKPRPMKQYHESTKSKKTVGSMIIDKNKKEPNPPVAQPGKENKKPAQAVANMIVNGTDSGGDSDGMRSGPEGGSEMSIEQKRAEFFKKKMGGGGKKTTKSPSKPESKKSAKQARTWDLSGTSRDEAELDVFNSRENSEQVNVSSSEMNLKGQGAGHLKGLEVEESSDEDMEENDRDDSSRQTGYGFFNIFKSLSVSKTLTHESVAPVLDKMKDHLIAKNVASDIAEKLCESVAGKLEGKVIGTFSGIANTVKTTLQDSCVQILTPKRRIDILRDAMDARTKGRPYCITFCGVNGVGKSTNLSKVAFWLIENGLSVLIAACDTFRAGAVEQLRTHERKLNTIHSLEGKQAVKLFEKGYDKDAASVAMSAIAFARDMRYDVVLIDTAGRMQDNEPLMRSLAKLIKINQPDLVLFVGEALVGNEAVDQLVKFNQALADHSQEENPHLIDGIVLTKFDTIDDKVGAAISMTYITGQPIVFVGTGQTYTDLKTLNAKAVVNALMKA